MQIHGSDAGRQLNNGAQSCQKPNSLHFNLYYFGEQLINAIMGATTSTTETGSFFHVVASRTPEAEKGWHKGTNPFVPYTFTPAMPGQYIFCRFGKTHNTA